MNKFYDSQANIVPFILHFCFSSMAVFERTGFVQLLGYTYMNKFSYSIQSP